MAYLGLLPSEHSTGEDLNKGAITKCGNAHVRWILTEAAQHYFLPPKVSQELSRRQQGQPRRLQEISWQAQNRLHRRGRALLARGKSKQKAVTAVARELAGFLWSIYQEWHQPGSIPPRIARQKTAPAKAPAAPASAIQPTRTYALKSTSTVRHSPKEVSVVGSGGTRSRR